MYVRCLFVLLAFGIASNCEAIKLQILGEGALFEDASGIGAPGDSIFISIFLDSDLLVDTSGPLAGFYSYMPTAPLAVAATTNDQHYPFPWRVERIQALVDVFPGSAEDFLTVDIAPLTAVGDRGAPFQLSCGNCLDAFNPPTSAESMLILLKDAINDPATWHVSNNGSLGLPTPGGIFFANRGWQAVEVPEPTSAMLLVGCTLAWWSRRRPSRDGSAI